VESYESQAEPAREQVRRLLTDHDGSEDPGDGARLESDLRELQKAAEAPPELRSASPEDAPSAVEVRAR
jgi:hypothetical protein